MTTTSKPRLKSIHLADYKCFGAPSGLRLAPLTVVFGRNNAGKSAMVRALAILGRSVADSAEGPWDMGLDDGPGRGSAFASLPWRGKQGQRGFTLGLTWADATGEVRDRIRLWGNDAQLAFVRGLEPDTQAAWDAAWPGTGFSLSTDAEGQTPYRLGQRDPFGPIVFRGLVPMPTESQPELRGLADRLMSLRDSFQWLHGARVVPSRDVRIVGTVPRALNANGSDAAAKLVAARADLLEDVADFYRRPPFGRRLQVDEYRPGGARLLLDREGLPWRVELADVGEGMGHVLPVLVAVAAAARGQGPSMVVVEDPEVHLHDDGVRALLEWFAARIRSSASLRIVLETHSETLKLAVQALVRRGTLTPDQVNLVWAEQDQSGQSHLVEVPITPAGALGNSVMRGAFGEDAKLASELLGLDEMEQSSGEA